MFGITRRTTKLATLDPFVVKLYPHPPHPGNERTAAEKLWSACLSTVKTRCSVKLLNQSSGLGLNSHDPALFTSRAACLCLRPARFQWSGGSTSCTSLVLQRDKSVDLGRELAFLSCPCGGDCLKELFGLGLALDFWCSCQPAIGQRAWRSIHDHSWHIVHVVVHLTFLFCFCFFTLCIW